MAGLVASPPPPIEDWHRIQCTEGQFYPERTESTAATSTVYGRIGCTGSLPARFAAALFTANDDSGFIPYDMTTFYPSHTPPADVANFAVSESEPPLDSPHHAMCLVSDYDIRISCVRLTVDTAGLRVVTPLSPDDPLVAKPVTLSGPPPARNVRPADHG